MVARPFWIIGHNTNSLQLVNAAIAEGANALEIDVHLTSAGKWVVSHGAPAPNAPDLAQFLRDVSAIARQHPQLCLVTLDCKSFDPNRADALLMIARFNWADQSGQPFTRPFILSVPHMADTSFFQPIMGELRDTEGLMVDEDNEPAVVAKFFASHNVKNACFGDGVTALAPGPNVRPAIELATALKVRDGRIKFTYSWTFVQPSSMAEQIEVGVDGIISDNIPALAKLLHTRFATTVRLATAADNPFAPSVPAYAFSVFTGSGGRPAETVELTLRGSVATAQKTVDASLTGRFDPVSTTFVTILGQEVGEPEAISIRSTGSPWKLESINLLGTPKAAVFDTRITPGAAGLERPFV